MSEGQVRYNPGIHGEARLISEFTVRGEYLQMIVGTLAEKHDGPSRHLVVVGPRGIGKTTLVRRVAAELRKDAHLSAMWYPIVFAEESYEVGTPGEFWLAALFHLADQTQDDRILESYDELKKERNETTLRERALAELMNFADSHATRILLVVENLNMILGQQLDESEAWVLRHTLQNEPRLMLLGTAPVRFEEISNLDKAWFDMVGIYELKPLSDGETKILWQSLTSCDLPESRLRPIQILTGGNPRLLNILASFAVQTSFRQLMDNLIELIDDHTEYFKGQLDALPWLERKVFVALLELWDPVTARDIAASARINVSKASSLLNRLVSRGVVSVARSGKRKLYQATERLYNIYYLMRRRGKPSDRVHAVVSFMVQFYEGDQIISAVTKLAQEACQLDPERRTEHFFAYGDILRHLPDSHRIRMLAETPPEFFDAPDAPAEVKDLSVLESSDARMLVERAALLIKDSRRCGEAEQHLRRALALEPKSYEAWYLLGECLHDQGRYDGAEEALHEAINVKPESAAAWTKLAHVLEPHLGRSSDAERAYQQAIAIQPTFADAWIGLGKTLKERTTRYAEAEDALRRGLKYQADDSFALAELGDLLISRFSRYGEGEEALQKSVDINPKDFWAWRKLADAKEGQGLTEESELIHRRAIEINPSSVTAWENLGHFLLKKRRWPDADSAFKKVVELNPKAFGAWVHLGEISSALDKPELAESFYKKALEINASQGSVWDGLARLHEKLGRREDAVSSYKRAIAVEPTYRESWAHLITLLLKESSAEDEAISLAEGFIARDERDLSRLTEMAKLFCERGSPTLLSRAEHWATAAIEKGGHESSWQAYHALALTLGAQEKWKEALIKAKRVFDASASDKAALNRATNLVISAAAAGHADTALRIVSKSRGVHALEPLMLGLKLFMGDVEYKAQEIVEIGQDVAARIRKEQQLKVIQSSESIP